MDVMELRRALLQSHVKTIGGLIVIYDNAFYISKNGGIEDYWENSNYFITGIFDTGTQDTKNYTWYQAPKRDVIQVSYDPSFRLFNNLSKTSVDYWGCSSDFDPNTRTGNSSGQFILFSVRKQYAANTYMYDNTNQRYVFKGKNVR